MNLRDVLGEHPLIIGIRRNRIWVHESEWVGTEWKGGTRIIKPILVQTTEDPETKSWRTYSILATWISDNISSLFPVTSWVVSSFDSLAVVPPETHTLLTLADKHTSSYNQINTINKHKDTKVKFRLEKPLGSELWVSSVACGDILRFLEPPCVDPTNKLPGESKVPVLTKRFSSRTSLWNNADAKKS